MKSVPFLVTTLAWAMLVASAGCTRTPAETARAADRAAPPAARGGNGTPAAQAVPVEVQHASVGPVSAFLSYNSTLEVETSVTVFPEMAGLVEAILVEEGDRVTAGQPLLQLEHEVQKVDLRESEVDLAQLEQSFRRTQELFERGLVNRQDFDTRAFEFEQAGLGRERARLRVEQATVRAPVDGVITERFVHLGARVTTGAQLFGLMSLDDMIAHVFVPGRHLATVKEGQEVRLVSEFLPGRDFSGWVKRIRPVVDASSGTFRVTVGVHPDEAPPPPGLFVNVRIVTDRRESAVLIPKRAVVYEGGERFVYVVGDGKVTKTRLEAGYEEGELVEVVRNISPGDAVVVLGQNALRDEAPVRIVNVQGPSAAIASPASGEASPARFSSDT